MYKLIAQKLPDTSILDTESIIQAIAQRDNRQNSISQIREIVQKACRMIAPKVKDIRVKHRGNLKDFTVLQTGLGPLNTLYGDFWYYTFKINDNWGRYNVLVKANHLNDDNMPVLNYAKTLLRIIPGSRTTQLYQSFLQEHPFYLMEAMARIKNHGEGILIHIPAHDGLGLKETLKLPALTLQADLGVSTRQAMRLLYPNLNDNRTYSGVSAILNFFGIKSGSSLQLISSNIHKEQELIDNGYKVERLSDGLNGHTENLNVDVIKQQIKQRIGLSDEQIDKRVEEAKIMMRQEGELISVIHHDKQVEQLVTRTALGKIQTPFGEFWQFTFMVNDLWQDYSVLVKTKDNQLSGKLKPVFYNPVEIMLRIDSGCKSGQLFHDLHCDCGQQLQKSMETIATHGEGVIIHIPNQDGRGVGEKYKLASLFLEDNLHINNLEATSLLNPPSLDARTYGGVSAILKFLGIMPGIKLKSLSNNPLKKDSLQKNGFIVQTEHIEIEANRFTLANLTAKKEILGHQINPKGD